MTQNTHAMSKWIEIDLDQFKRNTEIIKNYLEPTLYCMPIKANAYGHGMVEVAKVSDAVDYFAVSSLEEGMALRNGGVEKPILLFGSFFKEQIPLILQYRLECSISSMYKLNLLKEELQGSHHQAFVHLKVEMGMQRVGARLDTALQIYQNIKNSLNVNLKGIYSHLPNTTPLDVHQRIQYFEQFIQRMDTKSVIVHLLSSENLYDASFKRFDMARAGVLSFGIYPKELPKPLNALKPCCTVKSRVTYFKVVEPDQGIGYGHSYKTTERSRFVTIPVGYGDGYRRDFSNKAHVLIRGRRYPVRGMICMDQMMVELKDGEAYVGDEVVLVGQQGREEITVHELADHANTIPNEILCGFNQRMERIYHYNGTLFACS